ncbi:MAG: heavy metal translocating P-type ATPase metal-binding domain-containing protein [Bacteroidia bacterium]|jgi:Cu+-exporting ATPase|nr:heavy metal translocating P-type ATPase metal-binding domain-containing protein [Bacteroidia bacterium]
MNKVVDKVITEKCFHCGDTILTPIRFDQHQFCCVGCKNVYELLSQNNMCAYYSLENNPGQTIAQPILDSSFTYLDDEKVSNQLIQYKDEHTAKVIFFIPAMHCSSCIWLLEHLYKINPHIQQAKVFFLKKELHISYNPQQTNLREVVTLLSRLGYEPAIHLNDLEERVKKNDQRKLSYQIGVAGFCFGNIMLISFPEYFGLDTFSKGQFSKLFGYINLVLSLPVFFYSAQDYFKAAYQAIRERFISIDLPLALGIIIMFVRSVYEVVTGTGIGWFDTHASLVFLLLVGKWFQQKTFDTLSFDRDYKSYFPVAVTKINEHQDLTIPVTSLQIGDRIRIRNNELIPADSILLRGEAHIDFSFVTGESAPVKKVHGEIVYAGGRQFGSAIELEVVKKVSQSYLTQLWNNEVFAKEQSSVMQSFQQVVSKYFTIGLLLLAIGSGLYWLRTDVVHAINAFTAVLIIACPCALALSSPFALGTAMRILGRNKFYLKSTAVVEHLAHIDTLFFDKTGTLSQPTHSKMVYHGEQLSYGEQQLIASLVQQSIHPLSQKINNILSVNETLEVIGFKEVTGQGITARVMDKQVYIGALGWVSGGIEQANENKTTKVYVRIDENVKGYFELEHVYRKGLDSVLNQLNKTYTCSLLSGDNDSEREALLPYFSKHSLMYFNQQPADKLECIRGTISKGKQVAMIGDGLNDAGALKAATVGISITENTAHFSPASDVIMDADVFQLLPSFFKFSKATLKVIHISFVISLLYNLVGLAYAVQGTLSPLLAAILMPLSSATIITFTTAATTFAAKRNQLK